MEKTIGPANDFNDIIPKKDKTVAVFIDEQTSFSALLSIAYRTAQIQHGYLLVFFLNHESPPSWFVIPDDYDKGSIALQCISGKNQIRRSLLLLNKFRPLLLCLPLDSDENDERYLSGKLYEPIVRHAKSPICFLKAPNGWTLSDAASAFVPYADDNNTKFAIQTALEVNPKLKITAGLAVSDTAAESDVQSQEQELREQTEKWQKSETFTTKVLQSFNDEKAYLEEAKQHDFLLVGSSRGNILAKTLFGESRNRLVQLSQGPAILVREYQGWTGETISAVWSWFDRFLPRLTREDRISAYKEIRRGGRPNRDFFSMIALSASIASLGLILDSAAVIIGAMLVAPLMSAIIGMGMAVINGDMRFLLQSANATVKGSLLAVLTGIVFGLINFQGEITSQILQRTSPTILDLVVALISGIAAAYALCRKNVSNSLPGVAIAVALVPPLATVGVCLSIGFWGMAVGALKLFLSNMVAIIFASALVFASFGFRPDKEYKKDQRRMKVFHRSFYATFLLVVMMIFLLVTRTVDEVKDANFDEEVRSELSNFFAELNLQARVDSWKMSTGDRGETDFYLRVKADGELSDQDIDTLRLKIGKALGRPVSLDLEIAPVTFSHSE